MSYNPNHPATVLKRILNRLESRFEFYILFCFNDGINCSSVMRHCSKNFGCADVFDVLLKSFVEVGLYSIKSSYVKNFTCVFYDVDNIMIFCP